MFVLLREHAANIADLLTLQVKPKSFAGDRGRLGRCRRLSGTHAARLQQKNQRFGFDRIRNRGTKDNVHGRSSLAELADHVSGRRLCAAERDPLNRICR